MSVPVAGLTAAERVAVVLECLAVDRRIGGVIFVDLPPALLTGLAQWLNTLLPGSHSDDEVVNLGAAQSSDELWRRIGPPSADGRFRFAPEPGPLIDLPGGPVRTIIVPDLARANRAVVQAAVQLIGADVAVADRHGWHLGWLPRSRWLAACARSDIGRLSPHLLDRFAVRVDAADIMALDRDPVVVREALDAPSDSYLPLLHLSRREARRQPQPDQPQPMLIGEAAELVLSYVGEVTAPVRRDLALARTARVLAIWDGRDAVLTEHVDQAAQLLGFRRPEQRKPPAPTSEQADSQTGSATSEPDEWQTVSDDHAGGVPMSETGASAPLEAINVAADALGATLYPEDAPGSMPEYASLREPLRRRGGLPARRGQPVGIEPTSELTDIALFATLFEAAKFQAIRRARARNAGPEVLIRGSDLRRHRRQCKPGTALVLVLDHTCRRDWDWSAALAPYLRWVYVQGGALTMIELGHLDSADELRAEVYRTGSVLDGRVAVSLNRLAGRATPLASALDLAAQELRRQRRGRAISERTWLVVTTDGRGNVPLAASQLRRPPGRVSREGITDTLAVAQAIRSLPIGQRVVLRPPDLSPYPELPFDLADALGGIVAEPEPEPEPEP